MSIIDNFSPDFFRFIEENYYENPSTLRLRHYGSAKGFDISLAITQIECRHKGGDKLGEFIKNPLTVFPSSIAYEQASHEAVGMFHASMARPSDRVVDMTAGLGIDAMAFARRCAAVTACELDKEKADILSYNARISGLRNIDVVNADSSEWIRSVCPEPEIIFIDPARRDSQNGRVYNFHDCAPDIISLQSSLSQRCQKLLIKASPLLDITATVNDIHDVKAIRAISVNGECKEILVEVEKGANYGLAEAIDLDRRGNISSRFSFMPGNASGCVDLASLSDIREGSYLYEPNSSMMKLAPWDELSERHPGLKKFDHSSHLFVSTELIPEFPGRILLIEGTIANKDRKALKGFPVNIVSRNYPLSAEELRKRLGAKEGKDRFVYASRIGGKPTMIIAERHRSL